MIAALYAGPHGTAAATGETGMSWNTDAQAFAEVIIEFESKLPGFWWSVGQCSIGAHASCAVDMDGCQAHLLAGSKHGNPLDSGFHCDTRGGSPAEALADVMRQALDYLATRQSA